jgi:exodeoxyribonuclease V alpha subunit
MRQRAEQGHSEARRGVVEQGAARLLGIKDCTEYVDELVQSGSLIAHTLASGELVVALPEVSAAEKTIASNLVILNRSPPIVSSALDVDGLVERAGMHIPPSRDQLNAVAQVLSHPVAILTGGPGTGKTTITRLYLQAIEEAGLASALCAPTARAAVQLTAATGRSATTIHRLLGLTGANEKKPIAPRILDVDAVVCDEASMVGGELAARLVRALQGGSRLLLVGDPDQLESIEWGNLLIDLIASGVIPVARLTELHRTGEGSGIARAAREVLSGNMPSTAQDFTFVEINRPEDVADYIVQETLTSVRSTGSPDSVQVLTPLRHRGPLSSDALNRSIQFQLFRGAPGLQAGPHILHVGDKVMQTRNRYPLGIVNGDIGKVVYVSERHGTAVVDFHGGRRVTLARDALYALDPAYSMSVHKSQGGQFQEVIMPVHSSHAVMLTRSALYTGMTRAASRLKLAGDRRGLEQAILNDRKARRETGLARHMREFFLARASGRPRRSSLVPVP